MDCGHSHCVDFRIKLADTPQQFHCHPPDGCVGGDGFEQFRSQAGPLISVTRMQKWNAREAGGGEGQSGRQS
ncbi:unnamed protein product [Dibothriocephalus latus]|uniref:Uncharacterized protein n=1 Tax=Dibothriocephalus latus TaxID=60516 RepID=A0A3P7PH21_DIBLA|nr:unnamed protein product [Dibothriocephalus latus]